MDGRAASAWGPGPSEGAETTSGKGSAFKAEEDNAGWEAGRGEKTRWGRGAQPGQVQGKELFMLLVWKATGLSSGQRLPGGSERTRWGRLTQLALVQVLVAGGARVAGLAQAERGARQGVGAALGFPVARLAQAPVLQVTQEACGAGERGRGAGEGGEKALSGPWGLLWRPLPQPRPLGPAPVRPGGQRQEKAPTRSMQVAPGAQVAAAQSSRFSSQLVPPQPLTHTQWKPPAALRQVPPFLQRGPRWAAHSSTSSEQSRPVEGETRLERGLGEGG